jgi:hypothetical protein
MRVRADAGDQVKANGMRHGVGATVNAKLRFRVLYMGADGFLAQF